MKAPQKKVKRKQIVKMKEKYMMLQQDQDENLHHTKGTKKQNLNQKKNNNYWIKFNNGKNKILGKIMKEKLKDWTKQE